MKSNESMENYLETILMLGKEHPVVRSVDIAESLGFKKSSVSVAMKKLRERGDITVTKEGYIYLTESGKAIADMIYERHVLISGWLIAIGVDPDIAREDACRIEHVLSKESFQAIKDHAKENHSDVFEVAENELSSR
ncbi:MAG: metal-dependent transcriptional regulator [Clostridia bacterium]|nr:metal-dependent transcriptional regulator [Bacillota bacterium]MBR3211920.1 metal-dependent transcriptional regulator [Bacillota bacterium]MCR4668777.1 metal-dependent transcriptional regulator [Clostridia bacterium]